MNLFVFIFLCCWVTGAFGYAIIALVDGKDPLGMKKIPLALMTLGLSLLGDKDIKKVFIKSGKPFSYNSHTFREKPSGGYEMWDMGRVIGRPTSLFMESHLILRLLFQKKIGLSDLIHISTSKTLTSQQKKS